MKDQSRVERDGGTRFQQDRSWGREREMNYLLPKVTVDMIERGAKVLYDTVEELPEDVKAKDWVMLREGDIAYVRAAYGWIRVEVHSERGRGDKQLDLHP